jgi:UDP-N-acetylmuramyl pentapeptide phosphotransferase/UDP-N-acetylglucosamine-1-phosphate transferase
LRPKGGGVYILLAFLLAILLAIWRAFFGWPFGHLFFVPAWPLVMAVFCGYVLSLLITDSAKFSFKILLH